MEHRWHPRFPLSIPVTLHFNDGACARGEAVNISQGGIFIATLTCPARAGCVDVRLTVPLSSDRVSVRLPAMIVHRDERGLGLMFRSLDAQAQKTLRHLTCAELDPDPPAASVYPDSPAAPRPAGYYSG
ncbi:MAG: PilZ domain-containing protein [Thiohalocapsa sp.]|nr:PilZ domain-containing protein [Thiohalocapsa sp.]MCF7991496.1 PilZ domain-containing protein [Thiohalocapsa sp.]